MLCARPTWLTGHTWLSWNVEGGGGRKVLESHRRKCANSTGAPRPAPGNVTEHRHHRTKLIGWRDAIRKMAGDPMKSSDSLLDLNFQSLAARELNVKQMELDSATAKLDELRWELEKRRSAGGPGAPGRSEHLEVSAYQSSGPTLSPSLTRRSHSSSALSSMAGPAPVSSQQSNWPRSQDSSLSVPMVAPLTVTSSTTIPVLSLTPSPNMSRRSLPSDTSEPYLSGVSRSPRGRPSSPRPQYYERPLSTSSSSSRLSSSSYDYTLGPHSASPVPEGPYSMPRYSDWAPPQRQSSAYEVPPGFAPPRYSDDVGSLQRRTQQRSWNESDLDKVYEKKPPQDRMERASLGGVPMVKAWRESSLDPPTIKGKNDVASTLPRGYKFSPMDRGPQGSGGGTLPRSFPSQQPISRIPVPPPGGRGQPHRPLPLSMIFRLQNAFWEHQAPPPMSGMPPPPVGVPLSPPASIPVIADMPSPAVAPAAPPAAPEEVPRPLSPTRLQPHLPPQMADVQRVLEDIPRPLRRRGSQEHTSLAPPLPTDRRQYRQIMGRLFGRAASKSSPAPEQLKAEEKLQGSVSRGKSEEPEEMPFKIPPIPEEPRHEAPKTAEDPVYIFLETSESRVGASAPPQGEAELPVPVVVTAGQPLELRSALKGQTSPRKSRPRRARLDPLILLLDGALNGELDVVSQALREIHDPSQPNEEGITALHNAICGANFHIVTLLINNGANVNAADSHGWTPLHCAASCNDLQICAALVRHGAAIFATTFSDGSLPVDKCDPYREGYKECLTYLTEVEECMGETQSGVIYALWDYSAEFADELSVREGDSVTVLRKDGEGGTWWWAAHCGREGYVPRNYFGMYPRLRPQRSPL